MSYSSEEKTRVIQEQNQIINENGNLNVIDLEKESRRWILRFKVLLLVGLGCVLFCILVYGV